MTSTCWLCTFHWRESTCWLCAFSLGQHAESAHSSGHSFTRRWPEKTCFRMRGRTISEYVVSYTQGTYMLRHVWNVWGIPSIFDHYCSWRKGYKYITMSHQGDTWWQGRDLYPGQSDWLTWPWLTWPWLDLDLTWTWPGLDLDLTWTLSHGDVTEATPGDVTGSTSYHVTHSFFNWLQQLID